MAKKLNENVVWQDKKRTFLGLPLSFTRYALDQEKLYISTGALTTVEDEVRLYRILDVTLKRTLGQKLLGLGTIHCCSSDASMSEFDIKNIKDARRVKDLLSGYIEAERERKRVYNRETIGAPDHGGPDGMPPMGPIGGSLGPEPEEQDR